MPVELVLYYPEQAGLRTKLEQRAAEIHASAVIRQIQALHCPAHTQATLLQKITKEFTQKNRD